MSCKEERPRDIYAFECASHGQDPPPYGRCQDFTQGLTRGPGAEWAAFARPDCGCAHHFFFCYRHLHYPPWPALGISFLPGPFSTLSTPSSVSSLSGKMVNFKWSALSLLALRIATAFGADDVGSINPPIDAPTFLRFKSLTFVG